MQPTARQSVQLGQDVGMRRYRAWHSTRRWRTSRCSAPPWEPLGAGDVLIGLEVLARAGLWQQSLALMERLRARAELNDVVPRLGMRLESGLQVLGALLRSCKLEGRWREALQMLAQSEAFDVRVAAVVVRWL